MWVLQTPRVVQNGTTGVTPIRAFFQVRGPHGCLLFPMNSCQSMRESSYYIYIVQSLYCKITVRKSMHRCQTSKQDTRLCAWFSCVCTVEIWWWIDGHSHHKDTLQAHGQPSCECSSCCCLQILFRIPCRENFALGAHLVCASSKLFLIYSQFHSGRRHCFCFHQNPKAAQNPRAPQYSRVGPVLLLLQFPLGWQCCH